MKIVCLERGAWTRRSDQNKSAIDHFHLCHQIRARQRVVERYPDLRPVREGGLRTQEGTRAAVRTVIAYRNGVLNGRGTTFLGGQMEDRATDLLCRLMIAQRMRHRTRVAIIDPLGSSVAHIPKLMSTIFDEEFEELLLNQGTGISTRETLRRARHLSGLMVMRESTQFNSQRASLLGS